MVNQCLRIIQEPPDETEPPVYMNFIKIDKWTLKV